MPFFIGPQHYVLKVGRKVYTVKKPWAQPTRQMRIDAWWILGANVFGFVLGFGIVSFFVYGVPLLMYWYGYDWTAWTDDIVSTVWR